MIHKDGVIMRQDPSTSAKALDSLTKNQTVFVIDQTDFWYKLRLPNRKEGWIPRWLIDDSNLNNDHDIAVLFKDSTPIYPKKSIHNKAIDKGQKGQILPAYEEDNGWVKVSLKGQFAFVPTEDIELVSATDHLKDDGHNPISEPKRDQNVAKGKKETAQVRVADHYFLKEANILAEPHYTAAMGQKFQYLKTINCDDGSQFYQVKDENGVEGYIESTIAAVLSYSDNHVSSPVAKSLSDAIIMIDPGHGGDDSGATSLDESVFEKNVTLETALEVKKALEATGATVIMSRNNDEFVSLEDRAKRSNAELVDVFLSLHFDANAETSLSGTTTYYYHEADLNLAADMNKALGNLSLPNNGVQFGNYYVIRENNRPCLLLELGYITNNNDLHTIQSKDYRQRVADQITQGLQTYFSRYQTN
ncbi:N-acetylmuramoyl-L-alanine amidase [Vaginisenegalia massiliensis]|uniref:N-acetylmuramoyl-L-alanine amidase n=1 Tax=Vaginisenegalia massiliensis TaxID=2058294 RepID=UPI000F522A3A|nr:N-acetylmuramoyl-L-alanine amidase [Vaginisenegalia massiliensis]